ncbi:DedA family protein [uncultured Phyllobacterium sp.]|uniref:DedA family protein n=1 Tax=uncultured Phyllobacterium sp. TaxID=253813 RepID=UPI00258EC3A7|nr:DedA family protein [uncultured Phyllobacterium sp.]
MPAADIAAEAPATIATLLSFGLVGFGSLALLEKFIPVIPSYVLFMLLGMTVPDGNGLGLAILVTTIGSAAGALGWFSLGWLLGPERAKAIVARYGRYVFLKPAFYERLTNSYRSNHFWVTLTGQVIPTVRIYLALPAGVLRLDPRAFTLATAVGTFLWNTPFLCLGYALRGTPYDPIHVGFWASVVLFIAEGSIILFFSLRRKRRTSQS